MSSLKVMFWMSTSRVALPTVPTPRVTVIRVTGPAIVTKAEPVVFGVVVWSPLPETVTPEAAVAVDSGDAGREVGGTAPL